MAEPKATVIIPYYGDRLTQLKRTLWLLDRQTFPVRVIIADDGEWLPSDFRLDEPHLIFSPRPRGLPRIVNATIRAAWPLVETDYAIICHPENMAPLDAVERMMDSHVPGRRDVPVVYGLNRTATSRLDDYPWQTDFECIARLPGFMEWKNPLFQKNKDAPGNYHHINFSGAYRDEWMRFDRLVLPENAAPFRDEDWLRHKEVEARAFPRKVEGMWVYHQWHTLIDWLEGVSRKPAVDEGPARKASDGASPRVAMAIASALENEKNND
jgi:hypothetical protein